MSNYLISALYVFVELPNYKDLQEPLKAAAKEHDVCGTLLLAREGLNGTIAAPPAGMRAFLDVLRASGPFEEMDVKHSTSEDAPFMRMRVRLKKEIVSMGAPDIVTPETVGEYVEPEDWNALISRPDVAVIDVRNDYEVEIGSFEGAIDPETQSFRQFPQWAEDWKRKNGAGEVAMFCTGGIRCEKATAYMKEIGFEKVYHLKGGILRYLEETPQDESLWRGECFVFDRRVAVGHGVQEGDLEMCHGCRRAITAQDKASAEYEHGVSCPACAAELTPKRRASLRERQRQINIAAAKGRAHLGPLNSPGNRSKG